MQKYRLQDNSQVWIFAWIIYAFMDAAVIVSCIVLAAIVRYLTWSFEIVLVLLPYL